MSEESKHNGSNYPATSGAGHPEDPMKMFKRRIHHCPMCGRPLRRRQKRLVCTRCHSSVRGDTIQFSDSDFEELTPKVGR